ncbi:MAG: carboxypeptidase regulatory-like domain-containing protein [Candidatus Eisenbacteria bacterium]|nr:carboxypeptidase regulatory-like domain-containing protein [Candidatus Eisenbacteria bacterium]
MPLEVVELEAVLPGWQQDPDRTYPVSPDAARLQPVLVMSRLCSVQGRVVDPEGRPMPGATVEGAAAGTATTDAAGRFTISNVPASVGELTVRADGFLRRGARIQCPEFGGLVVLPDIVLTRGRTVSGRVLGPDGHPLPNIWVDFTEVRATTDADGRFTARGVRPGGQVRVHAWGMIEVSIPLPEDAEDVTDLTIRLHGKPPEAPYHRPISLRVSPDAGSPSDSFEIAVFSEPEDTVRVRVLDLEGRAVFDRQAKTGARFIDYRAWVGPLPGGQYTVSAEGKWGAAPRQTLRVSSIALVCELMPGAYRIRAVRIADGKPVARLDLLDGERRFLGRTDSHGAIETNLVRGNEIVVADSAHDAVCLRIPIPPRPPVMRRLATLLDRPIVRPGGKVGFKLVAREERQGRLEPSSGANVAVGLSVEGTPCGTSEGRFDSTGVYVDSLRATDKISLGDATLAVGMRDISQKRSLPITERPTPSLRIELSADATRVFAGDSAVFHVKLHRSDGYPASGVMLATALTMDSEARHWEKPGRVRRRASTPTEYDTLFSNVDGTALVRRATPGLLPRTARVTLRVTAQEGGSEPVTAESATSVGTSALTLELLPHKSGTAETGPAARIRVTSPAGPARGAHVWVWLLQGGRLLESAELVADSSGMAEWAGRDTTSRGRNFTVCAGGVDDAGRPALVRSELPIRGPLVPPPGQPVPAPAPTPAPVTHDDRVPGTRPTPTPQPSTFGLEACADTVQGDGPKACFAIVSDHEGVAHVFLAAADPIEKLSDVAFGRGRTLFTVPSARFGAGGLSVAAYTYWERRVLESHASTVVRRRDKELDVQVQPGRTTLHPGDTLDLTIAVRDWKGAGVPAEVHVAVYDSALVAFAPDRNPDLLRSFYTLPPMPLVVAYSPPVPPARGSGSAGGHVAYKSLDNLEQLMSPMASARPSIALDSPPRVREDFRDEALWIPRLQAGADGVAHVAVRVPDNLTAWSITAHAVGPGTMRVTVREAPGQPARRFDEWRAQVDGGRLEAPVSPVQASPARAGEGRVVVKAGETGSLRVEIATRADSVGDALAQVYRVEPRFRTVFGRGQEPGVAWDSVTTRRWAAPAFAVAMRDGYDRIALRNASGSVRLASVAAVERLGSEWTARLLPRGLLSAVRALREVAADGSELSATATVRAFLCDSLDNPALFTRADGSLDVPAACDFLVAVTAGRDSLAAETASRLDALAMRTARAARGPRTRTADVASARRALAALWRRFGTPCDASGWSRELPRLSSATRVDFAAGFEEPVEAADLWAAADSVVLTRAAPELSDTSIWLALLGGRGRGPLRTWPLVLMSHLRTSDTAPAKGLVFPPGWAGRIALPEVAAGLPERATPGVLRTALHRGHAATFEAPDSSTGTLTVTFLRWVSVKSRWAHAARELEAVRGPLHLGEVVRMVVRSSRAIEWDGLLIRVPMCGALDSRHVVDQARREQHAGMGAALHGAAQLEGIALRPGSAGSEVWSGDFRVTHAGRFTLLPVVVYSPMNPDIYRVSPPMMLEVVQ